MQVSSEDQAVSKKDKSRKLLGVDRGIVSIILLSLILILVSGGIGGFTGYQLGRRQGAKESVRKVTDLLNPFNAISNNPAFPYTVIGKVSDVSKTELNVKLPNGDGKKVVLDDKTQVSKGDKSLALSDIKKDAQVTVFTVKRNNVQVASRVIIR
jgi:hypothetical protein